MQYFLDTVDTIPEGRGFAHFGGTHIAWLAVFLIIVIANCLWYRRLGEKGRNIWNKTVALLLIADELFKMGFLFIGGNYTWDYLPLHLCSINIFLILFYTVKPTRTVGNFLYMACLPGALLALLIPTWTKLPFLNFMHLHSFTVHIALAVFPIMLTAGGDIRPRWRDVPKGLVLLAGLAGVAYAVNLRYGTNFMFLMKAAKGSPLVWFEKAFGNHLIGFPVLIAAIILVMYFPISWLNRRKKKVAHSAAKL